jgi:hypothetical protein
LRTNCYAEEGRSEIKGKRWALDDIISQWIKHPGGTWPLESSLSFSLLSWEFLFFSRQKSYLLQCVCTTWWNDLLT